jgi:polyisoprenoid-binding protein YceI
MEQKKTIRDESVNNVSTFITRFRKVGRYMYRRIPVLFLAVTLMSILAACGSSSSSGSNNTTGTTPQATTATQATTTTGGACAALPSGSQPYTIDASQSYASYEVQEQFLSKPLPNEAIGKTSTIQGGLALQSTGTPTITALKTTVNLQTLVSDSSRRDDAIKGNWLQSSTYPLATFVVKTPQAATTGTYTDGQQITFKLSGNMTVHNTTHPETFTVQGKLDGKTITGVAKSLVYMKDFGFSAPSILGLLTVKDGVTVTFNFTATEGGCPQLS